MAFRDIAYIAGILITKGIAGEEKQKENVRAYGVTDPVDFNLKQPTQVLDAEQIRALATGGILFYAADQPMTGLYPLSWLGRGRHKTQLAEWWGISSPAEALDTLNWLHHEGHRHDYAEQLRHEPTYWRTEFARNKFVRYSADLNIAAWDYARLVNVARWCYDLNYLSWEQAWPFIEAGTALSRQVYDSWESFANGFLAGRVMWQPENPSHDDMGEVVRTLLKKPDSLWQRYAWRPAAA